MVRLLFASLLVFLTTSLASAQREFGFDNRKASGQPYLKPEETVAKMQIADGFEVKLFAAEPQLVNPIAMTVDERGRVWVVECFEYPKRTQKGQMPRDRIKILEDTDGDGVCDKVTVFAEGKNFPKPFDLASGIEVGNGGVYLGAPPYLWFLKDTNGDDKADTFEILLQGFGSQDTHETLNTFNWGPDGKLYGLHGVFTFSEVKPTQADGPGLRMNAALWNFDPRTKKFDIFAEGTSNPWGCDYRNSDGQYILCCCVIPHLFHLSPGGVYKRQAGQSYNPYVYSYLNEICDHTFHKESGWAHAGLISLDTPLMPESWRSSVIFGSIHGTSIKRNILKPNGSTYTATRGDDFLQSKDKNFRPINLKWGPNGEIYCIDWHDQNPCHQAAADAWDYDRGRVYRFQTKGLKTKVPTDYRQKTETELRRLVLEDANPYVRRTALRLLTERSIDPKLQKDPTKEFVLPSKFESLNAVFAEHAYLPLYQHDATSALKLIDAVKDASPEIRGWVYRLLLDGDKVDGKVLTTLASRVEKEASPVVRRDLASGVLKHSKQKEAGELLHALLSRGDDVKDTVIPQLLWLSFESRLVSENSEIDWLKGADPMNPLVTQVIVPRTMRRLVATGKVEDLDRALKFILESKDSGVRVAALQGLVDSLQNRQLDAPPTWNELRTVLEKEAQFTPMLSKLGVSFRDRAAIQKALTVLRNEASTMPERIDAIRALGSARPLEAFELLKRLAQSSKISPEVRLEAIRSLSGFDSPPLAKEFLQNWKEQPPAVKSEILSLLASRKEWAREMLNAVGANTVPRSDVTDNVVTRIQGFNDKDLNALVEKVWGRLRKTPAELETVINKMRGELYSNGASFERGRVVFENQCAKCHKFDGKGYEVGPNIEGAGRDVEYLLANILDPNRVIGSPYFMRTVFLDTGVSQAGVLVGEDAQTLSLKMENNVVKVFNKKEIEKVLVQEKSLMPEGLGNNMTVQDFRDLVRFLMANPFISEGIMNHGDVVKPLSIGADGRIPLPFSEMHKSVQISTNISVKSSTKMMLHLGSTSNLVIRLNGKSFPVGGSGKPAAPDQSKVELELKEGINELTIEVAVQKKDESLYARFADPDRKVTYLGVKK
jgi:putative membrane-bound dehydrogenase-like protein